VLRSIWVSSRIWIGGCAISGWPVADLTDSVLNGYLAERRGAGYVNYRSMRAIAPLLGYLAPLGVLPVAPPVVLDPVAAELERYRRFLVVERGLTASTARGYVDAVHPS
jgi:hypothetical protein